MKKIFTYLSLLLVSFFVTANDTIDIVVGLAKPPYVLENNKEGFELDLVRSVLSKIDLEPNYILVPFGRSQKMLNSPNIDALLTTNRRIIEDVSSLSDTYIIYQNVVVSLASRELQINSIEDLSKYSIAAFQSAHNVLGEKFALAAERSPMYTQVPRQESQIELLYKGRIDTILLDINIFNHFRKKMRNKFGDIEVNVHKIFPKTPYKIAFKDKSLIEPFNLALREFIRTDKYTELKNKYGFTTLD